MTEPSRVTGIAADQVGPTLATSGVCEMKLDENDRAKVSKDGRALKEIAFESAYEPKMASIEGVLYCLLAIAGGFG